MLANIRSRRRTSLASLTPRFPWISIVSVWNWWQLWTHLYTSTDDPLYINSAPVCLIFFHKCTLSRSTTVDSFSVDITYILHVTSLKVQAAILYTSRNPSCSYLQTFSRQFLLAIFTEDVRSPVPPFALCLGEKQSGSSVPFLLSHSHSGCISMISFIFPTVFICVSVLSMASAPFIRFLHVNSTAPVCISAVYYLIFSVPSLSSVHSLQSSTFFYCLYSSIRSTLFFNGLSRSSDEHVSMSARREPRYTARLILID